MAEHVFSYGHDALNNLTHRELVSAPGGSAMPKMLSGAHVHGTGGLGPRQLASVLTPGGTHGFNWDAAGRLVTLTPPTGPPGTGLVASALVYDAFDRLRLVTDDDGVATVTTAHAYGSDGQRTATRWPDGRAELRPAPDVAAYGDGTGTGTMTHLTWHIGLGGARQVARLAAPLGSPGTLPAAVAEVQYLHQGFGPGTTLVTAADGSTLEERFFEPFGASLLASADYTLESHGWNAKPMDPWHEWSDHGARWHATPLGRWTAADPPLRGPEGLLKHGLDASTYGFVAGNPLKFWDPDGNQPIPAGLLGDPTYIMKMYVDRQFSVAAEATSNAGEVIVKAATAVISVMPQAWAFNFAKAFAEGDELGVALNAIPIAGLAWVRSAGRAADTASDVVVIGRAI